MELDHEMQLALIQEIQAAQSALAVARSSRAFEVLLLLRISKEKNLLVPALKSAGVNLEELLGDHIPPADT